MTADVAGARSRLNFSQWESLRDGRKRRHARKIVERIEKGEMPPARYRLVHRTAHVTAEELGVLRAWRDNLNEQ